MEKAGKNGEGEREVNGHDNEGDTIRSGAICSRGRGDNRRPVW